MSNVPVDTIDDLTYSYNDPLNPQEKSRVQSIIDAVTDPNAQPEGFKGNQNPGDTIPDKTSTFKYDDNGNLIYDGGKELTIDYNLLNLPRLVSHSGSGNSIQLDYTFGGEKIRKISPEGTRIYLGGVEYLDNSPESLTHSDGRVDLSGAGGPKHQFSIKDHLGNTVVLFEDANNDGAVFSSEVLQRNLYYPFGLELNGEWNSATSPRMDYLYNGKEFNEELELNWLDYGARWYDPAVGRFPSVDPLAEPQATYSPYHYVYDNPLLFIDPFGLYGEKKANRKQRKATKKYGEDRVTDVYFNKEKGEYGYMVYGEGKNKYTHITKGEKGELQASASKGYAIYGKKDLRSFKRKEGLFTPFYISGNMEFTAGGGASFELGYVQDRFGGSSWYFTIGGGVGVNMGGGINYGRFVDGGDEFRVHQYGGDGFQFSGSFGPLSINKAGDFYGSYTGFNIYGARYSTLEGGLSGGSLKWEELSNLTSGEYGVSYHWTRTWLFHKNKAAIQDTPKP